MTRVRVRRLTGTAKLPVRANPTDAGMDVFSDADCTIRPGEVVKVSTGIAVHPAFSEGSWAAAEGYGRPGGWTLATLVWDKSGMGAKGLKVLGGVIDDPYRGEVFVVLANVNTVGFLRTIVENIGNWATQGREWDAGTIRVTKGQKLANLLVQRVELPEIDEVEDLGATGRGDGGFGSTGTQ